MFAPLIRLTVTHVTAHTGRRKSANAGASLSAAGDQTINRQRLSHNNSEYKIYSHYDIHIF